MKYSGDCGPIPHKVRTIANNDKHVNDTDNWPIMVEWALGGGLLASGAWHVASPKNQKFKPHKASTLPLEASLSLEECSPPPTSQAFGVVNFWP